MQSGQALVLAAPKPRTPVWAILRDEFLPPFIRSVILALVISLIMALWIAQWITKPLQKIAQAAESVSQGRYQQIPLEGPGEVKALAKSFNEMEERVQASQRSQRDLIANVSHDLKTPLTSIQGFAQAILDGTANDADSSRQAASVIYSEAERMRRMVMDLLELARLDAGVVELKLTQVDLSALLRGVVEDFLPLAKQAQVDLQITADPGLLVVGDADRLAQVFTNLVDNSLKFTQAGGKVTLSAHPSDGWVEVNVCDTGPGIPPEELERIFERFYQIDKSRRGGEGRGVGLGLAIAREILHAHGGSITARNLNEIAAVQDQKSASGSGAVFTVRIPVKQDGRLTPSNSLIHSKPPRAT
jgi:signal transduction histidine kinase